MNPSDALLTKGERLLKLRKLLGLSQIEFGEQLSRNGKPVAQNYISKLEVDGRNLGPDVQERIEKRFGIRKQWLDTGIGDMFASPDEAQQVRIKAALNKQPPLKAKQASGNMVWVPVRDRGLYLRTSGEAASLRRLSLPIIPDAAIAIEIADSSMLPKFSPGTWVIGTLLESVEDMLISSPYLLITEDRIIFANFSGVSDGAYRFTFSSDALVEVLQPDVIKNVYHVELKIAKP